MNQHHKCILIVHLHDRARGRMGKGVRLAAPMASIHHDSQGPGSIPGAGTVNQVVHPSGVGKLVAVGKKWVTTTEDCYT
jgi:hypothetical protein